MRICDLCGTINPSNGFEIVFKMREDNQVLFSDTYDICDECSSKAREKVKDVFSKVPHLGDIAPSLTPDQRDKVLAWYALKTSGNPWHHS